MVLKRLGWLPSVLRIPRVDPSPPCSARLLDRASHIQTPQIETVARNGRGLESARAAVGVVAAMPNQLYKGYPSVFCTLARLAFIAIAPIIPEAKNAAFGAVFAAPTKQQVGRFHVGAVPRGPELRVRR